MKELIEKNKWLTGYLAVTVVSVVAFALFVKSQSSDATARNQAKAEMQKDVKTVNDFASKHVDVSNGNLEKLEGALALANEDFSRLKKYLSSKYSYRFENEFKGFNRLQVKQKLIERVEEMKKSLRDGGVSYDKDSKFGFEKYVSGIPSLKDAGKLEQFSGLTRSLMAIASAANLSEVTSVGSQTGIEIQKSFVGNMAKFSINVSGSGQSIKKFVEGLKSTKDFFVTISRMDMESVASQLDTDYNPTMEKKSADDELEEAGEEEAGVQQAAIAFVKAPVLKLDLDINLYLIEGK